MRRSLAAAAALALLAAAAPAAAETRAERSASKRRLSHALFTAGAGLVYVSGETFLKPRLIPDACRWCNPSSIDRSAREVVLWDDPEVAATLSDLTAFVLPGVIGMGTLVASGWRDRRAGRWIDDCLPVVQTAIFHGLFHHLVKFSVGRQRPFVHFGDDPEREPELDDDMSFYSGHTATAFAVGTSAAMVARLRGYRSEPVLWAVGLGLGAATGYLRMAADKHYLVDVSTGAVAGTAAGILTPLLLHRHLAEREVTVAPGPGDAGVSLVGRF
jgi:membrane-associated phospholipid phosphatase